MTEDSSYEEITGNIDKIAGILGIGLTGFASDLYERQTFLTKRLGGNSEIAEKVVTLARKIAEGKSSQKEIEKLRRKVEALDLPIETAPASPGVKASLEDNQILPVPAPVKNPHFSKRTALARNRLPRSGGHFAKWSIGTIFRGPRNRKK